MDVRERREILLAFHGLRQKFRESDFGHTISSAAKLSRLMEEIEGLLTDDPVYSDVKIQYTTIPPRPQGAKTCAVCLRSLAQEN